MNGGGSGGGPLGVLERLAICLVVVAIGLQLLAVALPRAVGPAIVVASLIVVVRIVWHITNRY